MSTATFQSRKPASAGRTEYVEVEPNVKLHVTDWGNGPAVVLIPGYPFSDAMYEYQYHALIKAGYRAIGITMRGFGLSDKPFGSYSYDTFADDIKVVLETLGIENATLGGHSMGGAIAIRYAAKHAGAHLAKLALFSAAAPRHTKLPDYPYPLFTHEDISEWIDLNNTNRPALLDAVGGRFVLSADTITPGIGAWFGTMNNQASPYAMEQGLMSLRDEDMRADLAKINVPTVIFHAREDAIVAYALAEQMQAGIKNATLVTFDKSGHASFVEELEKFNTELIKFLQQ